MNRFVVVTGLPASGKSTVGRAIAARLALPFLDKDEILESLFQAAPPRDAGDRRKLSREADESFRGSAVVSRGAVLVSWWRHPHSTSESGTPSHWLSLLPGPVTEVHCICDPAVAAERFLARKRYPGHFDEQRSRGQLLEQFNEQAVLGPLGVGSLVQVSTNNAVDTETILNAVIR